MKRVYLKDPIYGGTVTVIQGTWNEYVNAHKKMFGKMSQLHESLDEQSSLAGGFHSQMFGLEAGKDALNHHFIWINGKFDKLIQLTCLAHELLHAVLFQMELLGIDCTDKHGNQETATYWHSWAFRETVSKLKLA